MKKKQVSVLETFFDLVFASAVSYTTHLLISVDHNPDQLHLYLADFILMLFPFFWLWVGQTMLFNRFSQYIKHPALFMLPQMFFIILMSASINFEFAHLYYTFLAGYVGFRLLTIWEYHIVSKDLQCKEKDAAGLLFKIFTAGILIVTSSVFFEGNWRYIVMYAGILADTLLPLFFHRALSQSPVILPHLIERFSMLLLIAMGETMVSITSILINKTTDPHTVLFAALSFLLISLIWASYFYDYEHVIDRRITTNGQVFLYGHFFLLAAVMLLAADVHLLYENVLDKTILINFLFGAVGLFLIVKHIVFYLHRKKDLSYYPREIHFVFLFVLVLFILNFFINVPTPVNLLLLSSFLVLELLTQQGYVKDMF